MWGVFAMLAAAAMAFTGCTEAQRQAIAQQQAQQEASQASFNSIIVTPGDLSGQRYAVLGAVEWPGSGMMTLLGTPCTPDTLKREAIQRWGSRVHAIIGYHEWREGQVRCGGTAIEFYSQAAQVPSQPASTVPGMDFTETRPNVCSVVPSYVDAAEMRTLEDECKRGVIPQSEYNARRKAIVTLHPWP